MLVHGAFADSSGWSDVSTRLTDRGYDVLAFSNPLRGPSHDAEYLRQFLSTIEGEVVLVGHSYGGAVITNAATGNENVKSLVYVAAYAPAEGESVAAANALGGGHTVVTDHLVIRPFPGAAEGDADAYIDPAWFHRLFAQDLPKNDHALHGGDPATRRAGGAAHPVRSAGLGGDPELVPGREAGSHHPARGRAGDGRAGRVHDRRDRQLARRDDESPGRGRLPDPEGRRELTRPYRERY